MQDPRCFSGLSRWQTQWTTAPWSCTLVPSSAKFEFLIGLCVHCAHAQWQQTGCARFGHSHTKSGNDPVTPRVPVVLSCALSTLQKKSKIAAYPAHVQYVSWWPILTRGAFLHCLLKEAGVGFETIEQSFPKEGRESDTTGSFTSGKRSRSAAIKSLFLQLRSIAGL